jgi:hypothetical protein
MARMSVTMLSKGLSYTEPGISEMKKSRFIPVLLSLAAVGCHTYQPIALDEIQPSMAVRARLSAERAEAIARVHSIYGRELDGEVVESNSEELVILVPLRHSTGFRSEQSLAAPLGIPNQDVLEVELKKLDWTRTGALAVAGAALLGLIASQTMDGDGGGDDPGKPGGDPQDAIIPFRISIPWG